MVQITLVCNSMSGILASGSVDPDDWLMRQAIIPDVLLHTDLVCHTSLIPQHL